MDKSTICRMLRIDWEEITYLASPAVVEVSEPADDRQR
jgi:hypothetical protein